MTNDNNAQLRPRLAASSYLNTAPLIWSFVHGSHRHAVELFTDTAPWRCAEMLSRAEVNAALVPVIEYQRLADLELIPNVCVGSRSAVRSVVLVSRLNNLKKIKRVALDDSSRTSVTLLKIIFKEFLDLQPEWETLPPDLKSMLLKNDAALIIGDPAMKVERSSLRIFDLATLWHEFTGLGFVFAMWMVRRNKPVHIDFASVRDEGLAHLDTIAASYAGQLGLPEAEIKDYLTHKIDFRMDEDMTKGLDLFFELARKWSLIEEIKPLRFMASK